MKLKPAGKKVLPPSAPLTKEEKAEIAEMNASFDREAQEEADWDIEDHLDDPVGGGQVLGDLYNADGTPKE